jgi:kynureninase
LGENLNTGLATVSKSIYDAQEWFTMRASITNPIAELLGADKSQLASSDKLAANLGFKNTPSDILKKKN